MGVVLSDLQMQAVAFCSWPTPRTKTGGPESAQRKQELRPTASGGSDLEAVALMASWNTPRATDGSNGGPSQGNGALSADAGKTLTTSPAQTEKRGQLNPAHSRWLMGYPIEWDFCGATAMQSLAPKRRNLSKPI